MLKPLPCADCILNELNLGCPQYNLQLGINSTIMVLSPKSVLIFHAHLVEILTNILHGPIFLPTIFQTNLLFLSFGAVLKTKGDR